MEALLKKYHLPKKVEVILSKAKEGGFVVEFPNLAGCFTQVEDLSQLDENVTDAILTYFDVPREKAKKMVYVPETKGIDEVSSIKPNAQSTRAEFDLFVAA
ncbi:MAG: hypothetical protein FD167_2958 [bacterium]|nr:MAG: hypothetical protein FD167_2958 [bacterium]